MTINFDYEIKKIKGYSKNNDGLSLLVVYEGDEKSWLSINAVMKMDPIKTKEYLNKNPIVADHYLKHYG